MQKVVITSDAETVNKTYEVHQIDLDFDRKGDEASDYDPSDEIVFEVEGSDVKVYYKNGGNLIDETDADLAASILKNKNRLEIYQ